MDSSRLASGLKDRGNEAFGRHDYEQAIDLYTQALGHDRSNGLTYSNRALAYLKLGKYEESMEDCNAALSLDRSNIKALYRRAEALIALMRYEEAMADLKQLMAMAPGMPGTMEKMQHVKQALFRKRFECILKIEPPNVIEMQKPAQFEPPPEDYQGPTLSPDSEGPTTTADFTEQLIDWFDNDGKLDFRTSTILFQRAHKLLSALPTLVDIKVPDHAAITVVGDLHGNLYDLQHILKINGMPSETNWYLFNGDYVDRGQKSCEVMFTVMALKTTWPDFVYLARGNHEFKEANRVFGFSTEVLKKYGPVTLDMFWCLFQVLPLAHIIKDRIFVIHGGLSSDDGLKINDIRGFDRVTDAMPKHILDLLWSDPQTKPGKSPSPRGSGVSFGPDVLEQFLRDNNLDLMIRSHQCQPNGFSFQADNKLITVHSASNYCDSGNAGGIIRFEPGSMKPIGIRYDPPAGTASNKAPLDTDSNENGVDMAQADEFL